MNYEAMDIKLRSIEREVQPELIKRLHQHAPQVSDVNYHQYHAERLTLLKKAERLRLVSKQISRESKMMAQSRPLELSQAHKSGHQGYSARQSIGDRGRLYGAIHERAVTLNLYVTELSRILTDSDDPLYLLLKGLEEVVSQDTEMNEKIEVLNDQFNLQGNSQQHVASVVQKICDATGNLDGTFQPTPITSLIPLFTFTATLLVYVLKRKRS